MTKILLLGNPNCGKTTLFNALTGENQRIGNWPGVTVEKKTGSFSFNQHHHELIDLPGVYSLSATNQGASPDELITVKALVALNADLIINVVDAVSLERHLYLTSQILELGKPVIIALNMMDVAHQRGITMDTVLLSQQLQCPIIPLQAHKKMGVESLQQAVNELLITAPQLVPRTAVPLEFVLPESVIRTHHDLMRDLQKSGGVTQQMANYYAWRILDGDTVLFEPAELNALLSQGVIEPDVDLIVADARYDKIHQLVVAVQSKRSDASENFTARLDKIVLHRYFAFPIFLGAMYGMFLFAINIGGVFQDFFDISSNAIFVEGTASVLQHLHVPFWLIALLAHGVGSGINTTITFAPVIAAMFFFLALLETSGYMARAAFVVDKMMRALGLPGKSFVPMIVGFGCNVPAIMAARTLESERDRVLTVLMAPFMSCSARLAIYAVFVAAFFPSGGQNIVFSLYLIGIVMAVFTGFILRKTMFKGQPSSLILELPAYHKPSLRRLFRETGTRLRGFIFRAARLIIPVCVVLGGLNALMVDGGLSQGDANTHSALSLLGQTLTPMFAPMGIRPENWPATVGLLTGMLAKEVVIGTLNSLYTPIGHLAEVNANFDFSAAMSQALWSIPHNLAQIKDALLNPILASAPGGELSKPVYGVMVSQFDGKAGAFAYLLFILLYVPCVSTMAVIRQETNRRLMWFSTAWSFLVAYATAVIFYQLATFAQHPHQSLAWFFGLSLVVILFIGLLRTKRLGYGEPHVIATT